MTLTAKLTKNVTAIMYDGWCDGQRYLEGSLRIPKKDAEEDSFIVILGDQLIIDKAVLDKYGIEMTIKET